MKFIFIWMITLLNITGMIISLFSGYFIIAVIFAFFAVFLPYRHAIKKHNQYMSQAEEVSKILYPEHEAIKKVMEKK